MYKEEAERQRAKEDEKHRKTLESCKQVALGTSAKSLYAR